MKICFSWPLRQSGRVFELVRACIMRAAVAQSPGDIFRRTLGPLRGRSEIGQLFGLLLVESVVSSLKIT